MSNRIDCFDIVDGCVSGINFRIGGREIDFVRDLFKEGKFICKACGRRLEVGSFYCFTQVDLFARNLFATYCCKWCTKPIEDAISLVINNASQEKAKAAAAGGGAHA